MATKKVCRFPILVPSQVTNATTAKVHTAPTVPAKPAYLAPAVWSPPHT